ncbi:MAG: M1 family metallopeptidase [Flavobacteriales bacterium]|mgnify:FL=1|jgi:aminopeptidase N|tara:strand:- start:651 stop:2486 length:1836 start_codon:yes stop_codon:yes gene_type:complete
MKKIILSLCVIAGMVSCDNQYESNKNQIDKMETKDINDVHSYAQFDQAYTTHLFLDLVADFDKKTLTGVAAHTIQNNNASEIVFDIKDLNIDKIITNDEGKEVKFEIGAEDKILGKPLTVQITPKTTRVEIYYSTNPTSEAVQWLSPQQTADKTDPFLFTQGEAILTRSWIPIQDSPGNKITYSARFKVPDSLTAVMSAKTTSHKNGEFEFEMNQPIPCYLIALAIGKLEYKSLGARSGVYAEPSMMEACYNEFSDLEKMIDAAEGLYGPYAWEQYDVIVLPPSFPFGGMENPRLTFATPTIIAGDKSLTSLIAHELAHSWSGNLATNATWDDFWLNEGFTVYFEGRIIEELYGKDYADMLSILSYNGLLAELEDLPAQDTRLKLDLEGRSPDDGMSAIAYDKGCFMLMMIEENIGREKFDQFLNSYFDHFKFKNLNTEEFLAYINEKLPEVKKLNLEEWIYKPGLPSNCPKIVSAKFDKVDANFESKIYLENPRSTNDWTTHEWLRFIGKIDTSWSITDFEQADKLFDFTNSGNSEIAAAWFEKSIRADYKIVYPQLEAFLVKVGRRKFLTPLYRAMKETGNIETARNIYAKARPNYHFVSTNTMDALLK